MITGMGVVAPNGLGLAEFEDSLRKGRSGIRNVDSMAEAKFACTVAGVPQGVDDAIDREFQEDERLVMNMSPRLSLIHI